MSVLLVILIILVPPAMLVSVWLFTSWKAIYHGLAVICGYVFGILSALAIYRILHDKTVFMTNIHGIFENNLFLISGAYLGSYGIYMLLYLTLLELRRNSD
ncbi:transposase [Paenibacillus sp. N3.4]|uniref:transposase n=1 Tax=Paenibacillus sp. N3.4 TaxID=2603222 RepID=UPI0011C89948|nr:transposase [Paenibacillus sp. N3.4]TXK73840.1 transposase [Paenibacillus sp. N3.4]